MADLHTHSGSAENSSMVKLILTAVILLSILYFLAKGCTNTDEPVTQPSSTHGAGTVEHTTH